jgi:hypothetical protein
MLLQTRSQSPSAVRSCVWPVPNSLGRGMNAVPSPACWANMRSRLRAAAYRDRAGPEPNHAIRAVIDEAIRAREAGESKVIPFNLCGHGHFDMQAYHAFLAGRLPEIEFEEAVLADSLTSLPGIPVPG